MTPDETIFVYGSLRKGRPQHALIADARFLCVANTQPLFTLLDTGPWPAAISRGQTSIAGELYAVSTKRLGQLDEYERHPSFFRRSKVVLADKRVAWMWVYISKIEPHWQSLDSGDWG